MIINFCNRIPELYTKATLENKQFILRMLVDEIEYADGIISVKLKPIFEPLRLIKLYGKGNKEYEKVRTLQKPISSEVWEYLEEQVEELVNSKVRTLKTLIVSNKKAPEGAEFKNGALNGLISEPQQPDIFSIMDTEECQFLYGRIEKLLAA